MIYRDRVEFELQRDDLAKPAEASEESGRYELLEKLGDGGFADVWSAHDQKMQRDVAIKFFRAAGADVSSALDHARVLARVEHPQIVRVHDILRLPHLDSSEIVDAIIMELIRGETLEEALNTGRALPPSWGERVIDAVGHIHQAGIVHGDLHEETSWCAATI